ncbi:hypothetical protein Vafri_19410 [Volvox africanus]|uniref:Protein kinase domain-containing protein n=1 Tax=Volvox africanus TaxID=51714 RepID=A0A8J4BPL7_9CHLO|nr:hypothetical protein Vafri_19410 [Volvox africanus]
MAPTQNQRLSDASLAEQQHRNVMKAKSKRLISSIRRWISRSSSKLRHASGTPSTSAGSQASTIQQHINQIPNDFNKGDISPPNPKALPRSVTSSPQLNQTATVRSATWAFPKIQFTRSINWKLGLAPSMSVLSGIPEMSLPAQPCSKGDMTHSLGSTRLNHSISTVTDYTRQSLETLPSTATYIEPAAAIAVGMSDAMRRRGNEVLHGFKLEVSNVNLSPATVALQNLVLPSNTLLSSHPTQMPSSGVPSSTNVTATTTVSTVDGRCPLEEARVLSTYTAAEANATLSTPLTVCPAAPESMRRPSWRLSDYIIGGRLYKGEVSSVYKATCGFSGLKVVLKVYSLHRVAENALHTLAREVRIHTDLAHDNILTMYGVFEEDGRLVLVLERAVRGDLFRLHRSTPHCRMSEDQLRVLVLAPLLDALVYLHSKAVCHRDIKPENLLMTTSWRLRVADFGAAINLTQERAVTRTGTMDYMAPEVERCPLKMRPEDNKGNVDIAYSTAADVWSVGVLAYEMLVGFPPFINCSKGNLDGSSGDDGNGDRPRELCFPHFVSAGGQDFISSALAVRPADRPTAAQLLRHPWLKFAVRQHQARKQQHQQQVPSRESPPFSRLSQSSQQVSRETPSRLQVTTGPT